jgi:hypothetical protein
MGIVSQLEIVREGQSLVCRDVAKGLKPTASSAESTETRVGEISGGRKLEWNLHESVRISLDP